MEIHVKKTLSRTTEKTHGVFCCIHVKSLKPLNDIVLQHVALRGK